MLRADKITKEPREVAWETAVVSKANIFFYRKKLKTLESRLFWFKLVAALAASASIVRVLAVPLPIPGLGGIQVNEVLGFLAAVLAVLGSVLNYQEKTKIAAVMLSRYMQHYQKLEFLFDKNRVQDWSPELEEVVLSFYETERLEADRVSEPSPSDLKAAEEKALIELGLTQQPALPSGA